MSKVYSKKLITRLFLMSLITVMFALPIFADSIPVAAKRLPPSYGFTFDSVVYEWGYGNTFYGEKKSNRSALVITTKETGGTVSPSQTYNTRLGKATQSGDPVFVGHKWACRPDSEESIPYDTTGLIGSRIRAEFSLRTSGSSAIISGHWTPDAP